MKKDGWEFQHFGEFRTLAFERWLGEKDVVLLLTFGPERAQRDLR